MKRFLLAAGITSALLLAAFALSLINDGAREWLFNIFRSQT